jgi:hypothetical protein
MNPETQAKRARTGWIQESVRTPKRNQQEVTEATERKVPFPLRLLRFLLFNFGVRVDSGIGANAEAEPTGGN